MVTVAWTSGRPRSTRAAALVLAQRRGRLLRLALGADGRAQPMARMGRAGSRTRWINRSVGAMMRSYLETALLWFGVAGGAFWAAAALVNRLLMKRDPLWWTSAHWRLRKRGGLLGRLGATCIGICQFLELIPKWESLPPREDDKPAEAVLVNGGAMTAEPVTSVTGRLAAWLKIGRCPLWKAPAEAPPVSRSCIWIGCSRHLGTGSRRLVLGAVGTCSSVVFHKMSCCS